jgi:hypothetical protein
MIVLLEGPDGSGKTTLAKALMLLDFNYVHMSVPRPARDPLVYWLARFRGERHPLIIDRMHWSEDVYGAIFRGGSALSPHHRWMLEGWLLAHDAVVVLCLPPLETVLANVALTPDAKHHADPEMVKRVYKGFDRGWETNLPKLIYDYTGESLAKFLRRLSTVQRVTSHYLPDDHEGVGSSAPRWVFVGDRHGRCRGPCGVPLVFKSACGDYLRQALDVAGLSLTEYHVLNGWLWNEDGTVRTHDVWDTRWRHVPHVALGRRAEDALAAAGITPVATLPHPQWWKRFHFADLAGYAARIEEATRGR